VLDRLATSTLLTTGQHDPMWTTADARAAAAHLANGALVILPGAGHIGPPLQAAPPWWSWSPPSGDPAATVAHHRSATATGSRPPAA
jgi:hypothetical protein